MFLTSQKLIIRPILTEKSDLQRTEQNKYHFEVHSKATKSKLKRALEDIFNVKINKCWIINSKGKKFKTRTQQVFFKKNKKKAIVSLKKGSQPFSFYESF